MQNSIFRRLLTKITRSTFGKSVLMLAGGTAIAQVLNIATSPIISRLFSPGDFGVLSVYTSILSILAVFATLRYEFAIPIAEDDKSAINVLALTLGSVGFISLVSLALFGLFSDSFATLLNAQQLKPYFWLISVGILASGTYTAFRYWAFRKKNFKTITKTTINQSIAHQAINLLWGFFIGGPIGLIVGTIVGRSAGIWTLSRDIRKDESGLTKSISLPEIGRLAKRYIKFPLFSSWAAILNSLGIQLPVLLLSSIYGTEVTGSFGFANRIVALPMTFIGVAVGEVFFSEASSIARTDPKRLLSLSRRLNKRLILIGIVPFSILAIFGPSLFAIIFGEPWREAGRYASVLSFMVYSRFITTPVSNVLNILEKQLTALFLNIVRVALVVFAFGFSATLSIDPFTTVLIYSVSMIFIYIATFFLAQKAMKSVSIEENQI
jgi:O-antigen/teichoic acid export membrane protein